MPDHKRNSSFQNMAAATLVSTFALLGATHATASENEVWSGSFETGDILQWHHPEVHTAPWIWGIPEYCRPDTFDGVFGGDGSCLSVSRDITRHGEYSARFTVKNAANGEEPRDCDSGERCHRRRSQLSNYHTLPDVYNALPYGEERWISFSIYLPENWQPADGGWGVSLAGFKPRNNTSSVSGVANLVILDESWQIHHRWSSVLNPTQDDVPWRQNMIYRKDYPQPGSDWEDGELDFPSPDESRTALGSINKGGWTDWVIHVKFDARGSGDGGEGFLRYYKREDDGPWVKVVDIEPRATERAGQSFDRGIGYHVPPSDGTNGGYGMGIGLYMRKEIAWYAPDNLTVYFDNIRIGDENASLREMAPDSVPAHRALPEPPQAINVRAH